MTTDVLDASPVIARPWRTIWLSPRRTMRELLASEARPGIGLVVGLAALNGALATLAGLAAKGELSVNMAAMPTIIGVLQVVFGVLVSPFLLAFSGGWFGGQADPSEIRQSVAWSYAPLAVAGIFWIPLFFTPAPIPVVQGDTLAGSAILTALLLMVTGVVYIASLLYTLVLQIVTLAEIQQFSILKSIGSIAVWMVPFILLAMLT